MFTNFKTFLTVEIFMRRKVKLLICTLFLIIVQYERQCSLHVCSTHEHQL